MDDTQSFFDAFFENLFSFASMIGGNGRTLLFPSGSLAAASGLPYAGENYAIFVPGARIEEISSTLCFFKEMRLPFTVPQFKHMTSEFVGALETCGLAVRQNYTAMALRASAFDNAKADASFARVGEEDIAAWADTVWEGFGGTPPTPALYSSFARYLCETHSNRLFLLKADSRPASCALLHSSALACGLYYFATVPRYRRRGVARSHMSALAGFSARLCDKLVLLATEEGLPFYNDFGFTSVADIPMRSLSQEL
jgi:GNAT superfamily N-acetyltransferase